MPVLCLQTPQQSPLSGPHDRDEDAVPFDLLSQPFCWLTFSPWITNSVNCGRASHTNKKQGPAALFTSQKLGCLQWFQTQPSSLWGSPCIARTERKSSHGKAVVGMSFFISKSWCDERNLHSIKSCSPDLEFHMLLCRPFWLPREFTAIIITAVYIPPQANTVQALKELYGNISEQETVHPDTSSPLILNTGAPQGCILSLLLYSLYTRLYGHTQLQRHRQIC